MRDVSMTYIFFLKNETYFNFFSKVGQEYFVLILSEGNMWPMTRMEMLTSIT